MTGKQYFALTFIECLNTAVECFLMSSINFHVAWRKWKSVKSMTKESFHSITPSQTGWLALEEMNLKNKRILKLSKIQEFTINEYWHNESCEIKLSSKCHIFNKAVKKLSHDSSWVDRFQCFLFNSPHSPSRLSPVSGPFPNIVHYSLTRVWPVL